MPATPIEHIIVLMLENRSFDHMLGFLKADYPAGQFAGLTGRETVCIDPATSLTNTVPIEKATSGDAYVTDPDPGHEFADIHLQLFGSSTAPVIAEAPNNGFLCCYGGQEGVDADAAKKVVGCFEPALIPVISTLARSFVVCDHWFASVPGPTWPNRFFAHCATSGGLADSPKTGRMFRAQFARVFDMRTIYENIQDAGKTWMIYFGDMPQSYALGRLHPFVRSNFRKFDGIDENGNPRGFATDLTNGTLANYVFIEPQYLSSMGNPANDQHPPHDVRLGEHLIAQVYDSLRSNAAVWEKSLFVLLYDENGGFYDHVPPPATVNPDGKVSLAPPFDFRRLSFRVPAILISPWLPAHAVDSTIYDHASLLATVKNLLDLPDFLTERDRQANTFEHNFLTTPRSLDTLPSELSTLVAPPAEDHRASTRPPSDYQRHLVKLAAPDADPATEHEGAEIIRDRRAEVIPDIQTA